MKLSHDLLPPFLRNLDPEILMSDSYVTLDVETTNINFGDATIPENRLLVSCYKDGNREEVFYSQRDEFGVGHIVAAIQKAGMLVAHNAKMELKWLIRAGLDVSKIMVYCTMVGEHVLAGNRRVAKGLGEVTNRYGLGTKDPYVDILMRRGVCPSEIPRSLLIARCAKDVWQTERVMLAQRERLKELGLLPVMYTRMLLTPVLADMEMRGLVLDWDKVNQRHDEVKAELDQLTTDINLMTGGINTNSPKQMAEFLYETLKFKQLRDHRGRIKTTPTGNPLTDAKTVMSLRATNKRQREFQKKYKQLARLDAEYTKALKKFKECVDNKDLLYAQFNQAVTATHRLSSSGGVYKIQFQNLARGHKPLFTARYKGWLVGEIDGAQLEFRVAVYLGQDVVGYISIKEGEDVHSFTASVLTEAGQATDRQGAKEHTFKPLYGGQSGTDAEVAYYTAFKKKYPGIGAAQESWKQEAVRTDRLRLASGLILYFPNTKVARDGYVTNSTQICNYPVQSLATAEIIPIAVVYMWHYMRLNKLRSFLVNTVHDSAISEIHPEEVDHVRTIGEHSFTSEVYNYLEKVYGIKFNVPLGTGFKAGTHWSLGEEILYQREPPYAPPSDDKHSSVGDSSAAHREATFDSESDYF